MLELLPAKRRALPIDVAKLRTWPRLGCSIASIVLKREYPIRQIAQIYADCGVQFTSVNLLSAEWPSMVHQHVRPFLPAHEVGKYDLYRWNPEHFDRVQECQEEMNGRGIVVQWCLEELYRWSIRKAGPDTPDARLGPFAKANNVNGIDYVGPYYPDKRSAEAKEWDSDMLAHTLPDPWERAYLARVQPFLKLGWNFLLCGNEFPEKSFHERVRDHVRSLLPNALVSVNRNDDTPGQYANMKIGRDYDLINFHGRHLNSQGDLDTVYPSSVSSVPTFRTLLKLAETQPQRIVFSSDGARTSDDPVHTYDYPALFAFAFAVCAYGANFEHQSRCKLSDYPNLHLIETDWLTKLAKEFH
jgi:hypothetical protein